LKSRIRLKLIIEEGKLKELLARDNPFEDYEGLVLADAFVFRFIKAQSAMEERLFPHFVLNF